MKGDVLVDVIVGAVTALVIVAFVDVMMLKQLGLESSSIVPLIITTIFTVVCVAVGLVVSQLLLRPIRRKIRENAPKDE
jgi:hypothetical protein